MTMGPILSDPTLDPMNTTTSAWSLDSPMRVSAIVAKVSIAETIGLQRTLLCSSDSLSKGVSTRYSFGSKTDPGTPVYSEYPLQLVLSQLPI